MSTFSPEARVARLASFRAKWYWAGTLGWIAWFVTPLGPGWLIGRVFHELQLHGDSGRFLLGAYIGAALLIFAAHRTYVQGVEAAKALARANVINGQLASGGGEAAPRTVPVGDILTRLRDDPFDVLFLMDNWVDMLGAILYGAGAVFLLSRIDPLATAAGIVPMIAVGFGNRMIANLARRYREEARRTSSAVGDFLNSAFEASLTVKVSGSRRHLLDRFDALSAQRARASVRDSTWNEVIWTVNGAAADIFVGVALVVASRRNLDAGDITLFASYLFGMVWLPMRLGGIIVGRRRYQVSAGRLDALVAPRSGDADIDRLVERRDLPVLGGPAAAAPTLASRVRLETLRVEGLTVASRGLIDLSFTVKCGSLVVVSGPVGAGKTSLLRAVIGLIDIDSGSVRWNEQVIRDRPSFFVPPQCAYVSQVPRLFAESLRDNLRLGHHIDDAALHRAAELAAFDRDLAELPDGLETLVGARGVRLSGGQAQRAAAARAIAQQPELLVLDDLTSALDVETEIELWERLAAAGITVLAASNRPAALARASHVVELG
jgi:ATP-binding cassette, subfamily B, bacterial